MIVDEKLVVEVKAMLTLHKDAGRQVYNYLRASNLEIGILLHFGREARFSVQVCPVAAKASWAICARSFERILLAAGTGSRRSVSRCTTRSANHPTRRRLWCFVSPTSLRTSPHRFWCDRWRSPTSIS